MTPEEWNYLVDASLEILKSNLDEAVEHHQEANQEQMDRCLMDLIQRAELLIDNGNTTRGILTRQYRMVMQEGFQEPEVSPVTWQGRSALDVAMRWSAAWTGETGNLLPWWHPTADDSVSSDLGVNESGLLVRVKFEAIPASGNAEHPANGS